MIFVFFFLIAFFLIRFVCRNYLLNDQVIGSCLFCSKELTSETITLLVRVFVIPALLFMIHMLNITVNLMTNFKTVSLQGMQLTKTQKRQLEDKKKVSFLNTTLISLVDDALTNLQNHKEQGRPATKLWQLDFVKTGTPYLGDAFIH